MEGAASTVRPHQCTLLAAVQAPRESCVQMLPVPVHGDAPVAIGPHHPFDRLHVTPAAIRLAAASDALTMFVVDHREGRTKLGVSSHTSYGDCCEIACRPRARAHRCRETPYPRIASPAVYLTGGSQVAVRK